MTSFTVLEPHRTLAALSPVCDRRKFAENGAMMGERKPVMITKLLLQNLIWVVAIGALLFVPAGTLHWPAAWAFLATIAVLGVIGGLWLAKPIRRCSPSGCAR